VAGVAEDKEQSFKAKLEGWLPGLSKEKIPERRDSQQKLQQLCFELGTPGREAQRTEACKVMAETLGTKLAKPARIWLLKQLEYIGGEECVDAVARSLDDSDQQVRDAARRALANIPAAQANAKLLAKLGKSSGSFRVGLINALGYRADAASVAALAGLLGDKDKAAVEAAANALGKIGGPQATAALKAAYGKASPATKVPVGDAYLRCADKLLKQGKTDAAMVIYGELSSADSPKVIRMAALRGKLKAAGKAD